MNMLKEKKDVLILWDVKLTKTKVEYLEKLRKQGIKVIKRTCIQEKKEILEALVGQNIYEPINENQEALETIISLLKGGYSMEIINERTSKEDKKTLETLLKLTTWKNIINRKTYLVFLFFCAQKSL